MIQSSKSKSNHLLTLLYSYIGMDSVSETETFIAFAYFQIDQIDMEAINKFHLDWRTSVRREATIHQLHNPIILYDSDYIYEQSDIDNNGFEYITMDSLSYLKQRPDDTPSNSVELSGTLILHPDYFILHTEKLFEESICPRVLYRSPHFTYSRLMDQVRYYYERHNE